MAIPSSISPGFIPAEAELLLAVAQQAYNDTPNMPTSTVKVPCLANVPKPPSNWQIDTDYTPTTTTALDNFWQVWRNTTQGQTNQYIISVRGTVDTDASILADVLLPLVKARIDIEGFPVGLYLARDEGENSPVVAGVHAGFLLSLLLMLLTTDKPLLGTLTELATPDNEIYITGHSQGASIATLLTSLVHHEQTFSGPRYKSYVFAPAKPGNDHYGYDYAKIVGLPGFGFTVINTQGWVPQVPFTIEGLSSVNRPNPVFEFDGTLNPEIPSALQAVVNEVDAAADAIWTDVEKALDELVKKIEGALPSADFPLTTADLGIDGEPQPLDGSIVSALLAELDKLILRSLNYAKAGALVPLFATPGGNPDDSKFDQFDPFWQHHLCNYLFYLKEQYPS